MTTSFASAEWAEALHRQLQDAAPVRAEAASWVYGPLVLVVDADEEHALEATALRVELHEGVVRGVTVVPVTAAALAPFAIGGSLARWKAVFGGSLDLVDGILQSRLRVRGDLPTLVRHRELLVGLAAAGREVATSWQDEQEAAAVQA